MDCAPKRCQFSNAEKCRRWRLLKKWTAYRQPQDDHQRALIERIVTAQVVLERLRFLQEEACAENRLAALNWIEAHPEDRDRLGHEPADAGSEWVYEKGTERLSSGPSQAAPEGNQTGAAQTAAATQKRPENQPSETRNTYPRQGRTGKDRRVRVWKRWPRPA